MSTATAELLSNELPSCIAPERKRGIGILELLGPQGRVELPLSSVSISAKVSSFVAQVTVQQTFKNTATEHLEAEYVFPLAGGCAVGHFELRVAGRVVVGKVEERGEARRQYAEAIAQGKRAALLEQERSNVFTVKVGNLPPGEEATVQLTYSERLSFFEDGSGELRLPLVVAPRYMAGDALGRAQNGSSGSGVEGDTVLVPDASRLSPPRLAEGFDAKVNLKLEVELMRAEPAEQSEDDREDKLHDQNQALEFDQLSCSQHATRTAMNAQTIRVQLARAEKLDRDFVLRWRMGGASVSSSMQVYAPTPIKGEKSEAKEGAFALVTLVPPRREGFLGLPREVVFVVDRSGSMEGVKMTSAASACAQLLRTLGPRDRFAVSAFDNVCEWMEGGQFLAADEAGLEKGEAFLRGITARGGTELDVAMREALASLQKQKAASEKSAGLPIIVLLTDGQVGDESSVLRRLQTSLGDARVFTVGIDSAVNDGFLRRLSALGGGTATFVEPGSALEEALRAVGREIGAPLVTDLKLADAGSGLDESSLAPHAIPDLFEGRPASVFVRVKKGKALTLTGKWADGKKFKQTVQAQELELPALAQLWAKARVTDLEDRFRLSLAGAVKQSSESIKQEIIALSCKHTLLTRFTAFIAVDQEIVNPGGEQKKLVQPVEMPADWEMQKSALAPHAAKPMMMMPPPAPPPAPMPVAASPVMTSATTPVFAESEAFEALSGAPGAGGMAPMAAPSGASVGSGMGGRHRSMGPAMPAAKKSKGGVASGLLSKVANALGSIGGPSKEAESADDEAKRDGGEALPAEETAAVRAAIESLATALGEVQRDLAAGQTPAPAALEAARDALLKLLASYAGAARLPLLQRFLRTAAAELVAALRSQADAKSLQPLAARHAKAFAEARAEADVALGAVAPKAGASWEATI